MTSSSRAKIAKRSRRGRDGGTVGGSSRPASLQGWISDEEQQSEFRNFWKDHNIIAHKYLNLNFFRAGGFTFQDVLRSQGLNTFVELKGNYYPDLVRVFYANLFRSEGLVRSHVKGVDIILDDDVWIKVGSLRIGSENVIVGFENFNKLDVYQSCLRNLVGSRDYSKFKTGGMKKNERLFAFVIAWVLVPRGSNHAQMTMEDMYIIYALKNDIHVNWPVIICDTMSKALCLALHPLPYSVFISKVLEYYNVDVQGETSRILFSSNHIETAALHHMGFVKRGKQWLFKHEVEEHDTEDMETSEPEAEVESQVGAANPASSSNSAFEMDVVSRLDRIHQWQIEKHAIYDARFDRIDAKLTSIERLLTKQHIHEGGNCDEDGTDGGHEDEDHAGDEVEGQN